MTVVDDRHRLHLWHETAAGEIRCAEQGCRANKIELEASAATRVELVCGMSAS